MFGIKIAKYGASEKWMNESEALEDRPMSLGKVIELITLGAYYPLILLMEASESGIKKLVNRRKK